MTKYKIQNDYIVKELRLKTSPIAITYFKEFDEDIEWELADRNFYRPREPLNLCQFIGITRYHQRKTVITLEDQVCKIGLRARANPL